jgi:CheY-like chemotaxis protein
MPNDTQPAAPARVWLVDDSSSGAEHTRGLLSGAGYQVEMFADGASLLERLAQPGVSAPDVLLLDWHMPGVSGLEVCRFLRGRFLPTEGGGRARASVLALRERSRPHLCVSRARAHLRVLQPAPPTARRGAPPAGRPARARGGARGGGPGRRGVARTRLPHRRALLRPRAVTAARPPGRWHPRGCLRQCRVPAGARRGRTRGGRRRLRLRGDRANAEIS